MVDHFLLTLQLWIATTLAACYYRNGQLTSAEDDYFQCPGVNTCCAGRNSCTNNGLCQDANNQGGSLTYFPDLPDPGPYNYTGLFVTPACADQSWSGCLEQCTASTSLNVQYVWDCETSPAGSSQANYCCHDDSVDLAQKSCCNDPSRRFSLQAARPLGQTSTSASTGSASTVTATGTSTNSTAPVAPPSTSIVPTTPAQPPGLSTRATVGIGVGVGVGAFILLALIATIFRLKRKNSKLSRQSRGASRTDGPSEKAFSYPANELDSTVKDDGQSAAAQHERAELDVTRDRAELEGRY